MSRTNMWQICTTSGIIGYYAFGSEQTAGFSICSVATFFLTALVLISMSSTMELLLSVKIHALNIILC